MELKMKTNIAENKRCLKRALHTETHKSQQWRITRKLMLHWSTYNNINLEKKHNTRLKDKRKIEKQRFESLSSDNIAEAVRIYACMMYRFDIIMGI